MILSEGSSQKLAASFCLGTFIALTPTIPLQTPLLFVLSWILSLNSAVTFTAVYIVNNPVTMIPIYVVDYIVGKWFFERLVGIDLMMYNPKWVDSFNNFLSKYIDLTKYLGQGFCIWYLFLGGLIFGLAVSLPLYPFLKRMFDRLIAQLEKRKKKHHETHHPKQKSLS